MTDQKAPTRRRVFDLVGESRTTRGGIERQTVLLAAEPGEPIALVRDPENPYDKNAELACLGEHDLGFIGREDATVIARALDAGLSYQARIHEITGGVGEARHYGVRISIAWIGQSLPAFRPRDERQERSREKKAAALDRSRDPNGSFEAAERQGCSLLLLGILAIASLVIAGDQLLARSTTSDVQALESAGVTVNIR
ncbi:HIRAN domain-containing protein [Parasphingopyxis lamellibrachiae]|uniref:HIRAN domain-containing protein n=1 Tax=Parasphingopyxis lamellibrachiae TaxID=680125 RepID=A0A3D9F8B1_9SPHN|nr:HIRAN domain-containing protein [Parasphingopyxis lamellibrachiae]RED11399.1 hypothetical protein DFR46_2949 [Parasphingopyxis lamellibrachiae]